MAIAVRAVCYISHDKRGFDFVLGARRHPLHRILRAIAEPATGCTFLHLHHFCPRFIIHPAINQSSSRAVVEFQLPHSLRKMTTSNRQPGRLNGPII